MFGLPEIAVSAAGYRLPGVDSPRAVIEAIAAAGVRAVVLDATAKGVRPRELTRSGRRDLGAILRRHELELAGLDLWIPPEHFADPTNAQRAIDATCQSLEMAAEMTPMVGGRSKAVVSVLLPDEIDPEALASLAQCAQRLGATLADHRLLDETREHTPGVGVGVGVDPVFYLMDGRSPGKAVTGAGSNLASARLSDATAMGRCPVGTKGGKLDLTSYAGALIVAGQDWVTLDVRDLPDAAKAIDQARDAWQQAAAI